MGTSPRKAECQRNQVIRPEANIVDRYPWSSAFYQIDSFHVTKTNLTVKERII